MLAKRFKLGTSLYLKLERIAQEECRRRRKASALDVRSDSHKEALAIGRDQGRVVRRYLEALQAIKSLRGRKTPAGIQKRLAAIDERIATLMP